MTHINFNTIKDKLVGYFDLTSYLIPQAEAEAVIREGVSFRGMNILILIVAIFIASLGLNVNSTAVIIGAMLISPLMGPIIGIGLAVGIEDFSLVKRSFRNLMMATIFSVATSCVYFMISPVNEAHSELLARTSPTIYDVLIGFFGGAAGILAIGSKSKGNVIPGVAIATALMPPLCTVGYGLATLQPSYFLGALYLFAINSVFIAIATALGVRLMKYSPVDVADPIRARKIKRTLYTITVLTLAPAIYLTWNMLRENNFQSRCSAFVATLDFPDTQVFGYKSKFNSGNNKTLTLTLIGRELPTDSLTRALTAQLPAYGLAGTALRIVQGTSQGQTDDNRTSSAMLRDMYLVTQQTITHQQSVIDSLKRVSGAIQAQDSLALTISPEVKVIFPSVTYLAISRNIVSDVSTIKAVDTVNVALVQYSRPMSASETVKFKKYLEARLAIKDITIVPTNSIAPRP